MNLAHLTTHDWLEFEDQHKAAYNFLVKRSLINEFEQLSDFAAKSELTMTEYDCKRFVELKEWHKNQLAINPNYFS